MGEMTNAYKIFTGKPECKRLLEKPRYRWEDNTETDVKEAGYEGVGLIQLPQDRIQWSALVNMVMNL
jgi:hypothetical protein